MLVALDYDGTITEDLVTFSKIVKLFENAGHTVIIVTMRHDFEEDNALNSIRQLNGWNLAVYYTCRRAKKEFLNNKGIYPDIWIDDQPEFILHDAL